VVNHAGFWIKVELGIRGLKSSGESNEKFWFNKREVQLFVQDNYITSSQGLSSIALAEPAISNTI